MRVSIALFTSDLRLHDNPVLRSALRGSDAVVPLFVADAGVREAGFDVPNRRAFLADCLADLDAGLRRRGGRLVVRTGDVVEQVSRVVYESGARRVHIARGATGYAQRRQERLRTALAEERCALQVHDAVNTTLPPDAVRPDDADHFWAFGPYAERWERAVPRDPMGAPRIVRVPGPIGSDDLPARSDVLGVSPGLAQGGETAGRRCMTTWTAGPVDTYADRIDDLAADATSRLSPYLHFGSLSPVELAHRVRKSAAAGADAYLRQLARRDFHQQVLAARPRAAWQGRAESPGGDGDPERTAAWQDGRTGWPAVDAAMRQLRYEGWLPGRARLLAAGFLTGTLRTDWRVGARHFLGLLVDGDVAENQLNWQTVAGSGPSPEGPGHDGGPGPCPLVQAERFDPDGTYVRRWVPELAVVEGAAVHRPWRLPREVRERLDYPEPVVAPGAAVTAPGDAFTRPRVD
ncbi:FAD-binding domain-containing protein [Streptomyces sp. NPDC047108]|uniref:FAD-binding domain-containing protein n=1 Tax=Streptomyces sp. NPDC047108 TaxID=3155025 RepID=UPI0033CF704B